MTDMTDKLESPSALNDLNFFLISTAALHSTFLGCALSESVNPIFKQGHTFCAVRKSVEYYFALLCIPNQCYIYTFCGICLPESARLFHFVLLISELVFTAF